METNQTFEKSEWETVVIGAGQAGLATGYHLSKFTDDFIILDSGQSIGSAWKNRWDSLRLFTPAQYDGLPGYPFPADRNSFPTKDELADYLDKYAKKFNLPIRTGVTVNRLKKTSEGFLIDTTSGTIKSRNVVVATGTNPLPKIPHFANEISKNIFQIHSSEYRNPDSAPKGKTLVVGAGTSGVEIAIELSASRQTFLSGKPTFHIPDVIFKYAGRFYWWVASNVLTVNTPIGRKARQDIVKGGGPLINISVDDVKAAGVKMLPRVAGVENGRPILEDGRVPEIDSIIWCTGFRPDFSWIDPPVTDPTGWPVTKKGVSASVEGLYFAGMLFQFGLTSGFVGGVGRDAGYVAQHIQKRQKN